MDAAPAPIPATSLMTEVEERLADGLRLFIESFAEIENVVGPQFVAMHLNAQQVKSLLRRALLCSAEGLRSLTVDIAPVDFDRQRSEVQIASWALKISTDAFWFEGTGKCGVTCSSQPVSPTELLASLHTTESTPSEDLPEGFAWYGGALVYSPSDLDHLIGTLEEDRPELLAKEREREMAEAIDHAADTSTPTSATPPSRRSPKL